MLLIIASRGYVQASTSKASFLIQIFTSINSLNKKYITSKTHYFNFNFILNTLEGISIEWKFTRNHYIHKYPCSPNISLHIKPSSKGLRSHIEASSCNFTLFGSDLDSCTKIDQFYKKLTFLRTLRTQYYHII